MGLRSSLCELRDTLPNGSVFEFEVREHGGVHLERLVIPHSDRGAGTEFLARVFAACDLHGASASLEADTTELPGDPSTFELVRWHMRFGCAINAAADEALSMTRQPCVPPPGLDGILDRYEQAKASDLTLDEFEEIRSSSTRFRA